MLSESVTTNMAHQSDSIPLLSYASMVWRRRFLVLIIALGMAIPAFAVSAMQTPEYYAAGQILLTQRQLDENLNIRDGVLTDTQVGNQVAILTGPEVSELARQQGATSPFQAVGKAGSNVVTLSARDQDPQRAAGTVEAYMRAFSEYRTQQVRKTLDNAAIQMQSRITSLQEQINKLAPEDRAELQGQLATVQAQLGRAQIQQGLVSSNIEVVQNPAVGQSPISPTPVRNTLFALVLGLALGISFAVLLETLRRRSAPEPNVHVEALNGAPALHGARAPVDRGHAPTPTSPAGDAATPPQ